ncbi:YncE family protein [Mycobacterium sp. 1274756.6]|uniref:YncE family protein n=1 Tax=Mycobacterium sp. 1274756.6 TaxID=1834076 RepID=UPI000B0A7B4A|nr:YncE family protein [Mycobacterium sp. 1274756.6]
MTRTDDATGGVALAEPVAHPQLLGPLAAMVHDIDALMQAERCPIVAPPTFHAAIADRLGAAGSTPAAMALSPDRARLYVASCGDDTIWVIDTASFDVLDVIEGIAEPFALVATDTAVFVSTGSTACDAITVIDAATNTVAVTLPQTRTVNDLAVAGGRLYASRADATGADVAVIDPATGATEIIELAGQPGVVADCLAVSPDGRRIYVAVQHPTSSQIAVIDTAGGFVAGTFAAGAPVRGLAVSADGATLYLAECDATLGGVVEILDAWTATVIDAVHLGGMLTHLALSRDGQRAVVVNGDDVTVLCLRTGQIIGSIPTGGQPACVVASRNGLYIADYAGTVSAVTTTVTEQPGGVSLQPAV